MGVRARAALVATALAAALLCSATAGAGEAPVEPASTVPVVPVEPSVPATLPAPVAPGAQWKLIVHPANALRSMAREELERIYRKRNRFWPDHSTILPLNLPGGDPLRRAFTAEILRSNEDELATYWNREYFQGVAPPAVLHSSGAVHAYVAATPAAIGYVSPESVDSSVAVVEVTNGR